MPTAAVPLTPISTTLAAMTTAAATIGTIRLLLLITRNIHDQSLMTMRTDDSLLTDGRRLTASERQSRCATLAAVGLLLPSRCRFGGRLRSGLMNLTRNYHQTFFLKFISKEIEPVAANDRSQILQFAHCRITIGYLYNGRTGLSCLFCY